MLHQRSCVNYMALNQMCGVSGLFCTLIKWGSAILGRLAICYSYVKLSIKDVNCFIHVHHSLLILI